MIGEPLYDISWNHLRSPNNFTQDPLIELECLVTNVTAVGYPARAGHVIFGVISDILGQFRPLLWPASHFVI